jgi:hypothetical protein
MTSPRLILAIDVLAELAENERDDKIAREGLDHDGS